MLEWERANFLAAHNDEWAGPFRWTAIPFMTRCEKASTKRPTAVLRILLLYLLATGLAPAQTGVYKWVGPDGTVTFTDQSRPGAEKIEIEPPQTVPPPEAVRRTLEGVSGQPEQASAEAAYAQFAIVSPADDESVRSNNGDVSIDMNLEPGLQAKHAIVVSMDGQAIGKGSSTSLQLQNLPRGTHSVQASVVDESGTEVIRTETVTFHLLRRRLPTPTATSLSGGG